MIEMFFTVDLGIEWCFDQVALEMTTNNYLQSRKQFAHPFLVSQYWK